MPASSTERGGVSALPRRDRVAILSGLLGTAAIAWIYLVFLASRMNGVAACGPDAMAIRPWSPGDFALMFLMWATMMVGMMVPTAAPATLIYAAVARKADREGKIVAPTAFFVAGYVTTWTLFGAVATLGQWALDQAALLSPMMVASSSWLGAALLALAGVYQLTPAKQACLEHCREPARLIARHWRPGASGAFRIGAVHGGFCLGCCWALMGLLFFGGVMNLLWIAAITAFVLAEKALPIFGIRATRWTGVAMILTAAGYLTLTP